ncbi:tyrosine-type recombinase/integrase [Crateriforma spongiae]|uniref:tyrosine-type recombinase/integrase n=1 Tax=Crateriforma spongiae TaxID=2724528 RepID=UPI001447C53F|nr:tyrosine-type recombinase/integrase [Crateriforma spongiae]
MTAKSVSSRGRKASKPSKPRKDFPLFAHASGQWAKKVRGRLHYFGKWDNPVAAEAKWERDKLALLEGRDPNRDDTGDTVGWLCNVFMDSKQRQADRGELKLRTRDDYHAACKHVASFFGRGRRLETLTPQDFERYRNSLPSSWSPTTVNNQLRLSRTLFKYANDIGATDRPILFRIGLKAVPASIVRKSAARKPDKVFTAAEVHRMLAHADASMTAFIMLGLNAAYGPADIGRLKVADIDFGKSWLGVERGKTGVARGCWLWPETVSALRKAIADRKPTGDPSLDELAFLTRFGRQYSPDNDKTAAIAQAFAKVKDAAGIEKTGVGHYALRHTFRTVAGDAMDREAVDFIMGHMDASMSGNYRHGIDPKRVKAVCQHVRKWFRAGKPKRSTKGGA